MLSKFDNNNNNKYCSLAHFLELQEIKAKIMDVFNKLCIFFLSPFYKENYHNLFTYDWD